MFLRENAQAFSLMFGEDFKLWNVPHVLFCLEALPNGMVKTLRKPFDQNQIKKKEGNLPSRTLKILNYGICPSKPACMKSSWTGLYERRAAP